MSKELKIGDFTMKIPLIQGGMGVGVSLSGLAGAVALCGGVGVISTAQIGFKETDFKENPLRANLRVIKQELDKARKIAKEGMIAMNIMVATQGYEDYVRAAVKAGVDLIISGAGLPIQLPKLVEGSKTLIAPVVSSLKSASLICRMWEKKFQKVPDLLVVEGPKAGGHLGFSKKELENIESLNYSGVIKDIIAFAKDHGKKYKKEIPVVVGGGVYDKADMKDIMQLGADGVVVASRFVTTKECDASWEYKNAYIKTKEEDISIIKSPVGMPGRAINNVFLDRVKKERIPIKACYHCIVTCNPKTTPYCITDALIKAVEGDVENGLLFCGSNVYRANKIESVEEVMEEFSKWDS